MKLLTMIAWFVNETRQCPIVKYWKSFGYKYGFPQISRLKDIYIGRTHLYSGQPFTSSVTDLTKWAQHRATMLIRTNALALHQTTNVNGICSQITAQTWAHRSYTLRFCAVRNFRRFLFAQNPRRVAQSINTKHQVDKAKIHPRHRYGVYKAALISVYRPQATASYKPNLSDNLLLPSQGWPSVGNNCCLSKVFFTTAIPSIRSGAEWWTSTKYSKTPI